MGFNNKVDMAGRSKQQEGIAKLWMDSRRHLGVERILTETWISQEKSQNSLAQ